ncbi:transcriptional regulator [Pseudofrankia sp. BMG5.37]|nr:MULTISPECIES: transcriptional regulator [unclassified Pseudofrankia]MDT3441881.1 transcriptional regulator [Pseudofrankia sp. BMG5.37]
MDQSGSLASYKGPIGEIDTVEISDSVLSKQVAVLETAGLVEVRKGYVGKRPRTWLSLTATGRHAFADHLDALREIAGGG